MKNIKKIHLSQAVLVALAFSVFVFLVFPLQSVLCNYSLFDFTYAEFLRVASFAVVASFASCFGVLVLSEQMHMGRFVHVIAIALLLAMYAETGPLSLGLPSMNGDVVVQRALITTTRKIADAAVLMTIVVTVVLCYKWIKGYVGVIALCFLFITSLSLLDVHRESALTTSEGRGFQSCSLYESLMSVRYAPTNNVIVLVLDSAPAPEMADLVLKNKTLKSEFTGFIGYANNIGMYGETELGMTGLMTGRYIDKKETLSEYCNRIFGEESALFAYDHNKYEVYFHSHMFGNGFTNHDIVRTTNNVQKARLPIYDRPTKETPHASLREILTYRILPARRKTNFYVSIMMRSRHAQGDHDTRRDVIGYPIVSHAPVGDGIGSFVVYHSLGVHPPISRDRYGREMTNPTGSKDELLEYGIYVLGLVGRYFKSLKDRNLYDSALIIIVADHGVATCGATEKNFGLARPMLFVKPVRAKSDFAVSQISTSSSRVAELLKRSCTSRLSLADIENTLTTDDRFVLEPFFGERSFSKWNYDVKGNLLLRENVGLYSCK